MHSLVGEFDYISNGNSLYGPLFGQFNKVEYIEKMRDTFMSHGVDYLRSNKLIEEAEEDDDYIDPEAYGLGSW